MLEGNYEQHQANGGCHANGHLHKNGRFWCHGMQGHFDFASGEWHYTDVIDARTGLTEHVRWLG